MCMHVCIDYIFIKLLKEHYIYIRKLPENNAVSKDSFRSLCIFVLRNHF